MSHVNAAGETLNFHDLDYDVASRITQITDIDGTHDYSYDDRDQLTGANHTAPGGGKIPNLPHETYHYDANGNRLESHLHGSSYVTGRGNRLLSDGTYNYEYGDEGNTIRRTRISGAEADGSTVREFVWDHRNRLVAVVDKQPIGTKTQEVKFTYDALDRRIFKSVDAAPTDAVDAAFTHFVYDREDVILDFVDTDGAGSAPLALDQRYLHGPAIDQVLAQDDATGTVHWHLTDHLSTVKDLAENIGVVANHVVYDSYGNVESQRSESVSTRYLFSGREFDRETALYYSRSRYYAPSSGRFLSEDLLRPNSATAESYNEFWYSQNAPTSRFDPYGLESQGAPQLPNGLPAPPPIPPPNDKFGQPNRWVPVPGTEGRDTKWKPERPVSLPGGGQPGASWDPIGHWDVDNGEGRRRRYLPDGTEVDHNNQPLPPNANPFDYPSSCPTQRKNDDGWVDYVVVGLTGAGLWYLSNVSWWTPILDPF
jgi:RHS repeat-associated protein